MTYQFHGTLTDADSKKHISFPFDVPDGVTRIDIRFDYSPKEIKGVVGSNLLSLSLFDPQSPRGAGHCRADNNLSVSAAYATPGYVPGALQAGQWTITIDTHMVLPHAPITYQMEIALSREPVEGHAPQYSKRSINRRGPGWYRGDLHGHTIHSDGHWDVPDFVQYARAYHLDFATLTDHNTVSGLAELDSYADDALLTMGGIELTTYYGHCLALGTRRWIDWRVEQGQMDDKAREIMAAGFNFVIAHPMSVGDPVCTGCDWKYPDVMPGSAPAVEIWNSAWDGDSHNEQSLQLWYTWLNQGYRLVATAGTDIHGPARPEEKLGFNVVYADELSEPAILAAIRRGHLYLSRGSHGPQVELSARTASGVSAIVGDSLPAEAVEVQATWERCSAADQVRFIVDGAPMETRNANTHGAASWQFSAGQHRWCLLEIRDQQGDLLAITNPIFLGR